MHIEFKSKSKGKNKNKKAELKTNDTLNSKKVQKDKYQPKSALESLNIKAETTYFDAF